MLLLCPDGRTWWTAQEYCLCPPLLCELQEQVGLSELGEEVFVVGTGLEREPGGGLGLELGFELG